jgi:hypothetical protein
VAAQFTGVKSGDHSNLHYISQREVPKPRAIPARGFFFAASIVLVPLLLITHGFVFRLLLQGDGA